jgi:hypothetical protein
MTEQISLHLVSFADKRMKTAKERLEKQAYEMSVFHTIAVGSDEMLVHSFQIKHQKLLSNKVRGYGYWVWKPHIIQLALQKLKDDEFLLYLDVGCHLNSAGRARILEYCNLINKASNQFLLAFEHDDEFLELCWTKGDLFDHFNARDLIFVTHTPQIMSGVILLRKCAAAVNFVQDWQDVFEKDIRLIDDSSSRSENFPEFVEHRHDQSVFSILSKLIGSKTLHIRELLPVDGNWDHMANYPIYIKRDKGIKSPFLERLSARFTKYLRAMKSNRQHNARK